MKRSLTFMLGLIVLAATSGYEVLKNTPSQVIHHHISCPTSSHEARVREFQILSTHRWAKGVIVLYSALCPTNNTQEPVQWVFGHQVMKREGMNWQVSSSDSYSISNPQQSSEKLIEYGMSRNSPDLTAATGEHYTILYGQILTSKVAAIEATFDNGQVLRGERTGDAFALISAGATEICELRILGMDNQVLRKEDLSQPDPLLLPRKLVSDRTRNSKCSLPTLSL